MTTGEMTATVPDDLAKAVYAIWLWNGHNLTDALTRVSQHPGVTAAVREGARQGIGDVDRAYVREILSSTFTDWARAERAAV